jgi:para-nitrobenzyl esterase
LIQAQFESEAAMKRNRHKPLGKASLVALMLGMVFSGPVSAEDATTLDVAIGQGVLRGLEADGVRSFFNIPFAAPPVGDLRWRAPQPPINWTAERDATRPGPICAQGQRPDRSANEIPMSEDCLTLNIWTPSEVESPLPVMVWVHGGGFMVGSGTEPDYDGTNLARKDVVLVTINYRLGPLGFLAHPELTAEAPYAASGNYGILDQIAALQWVRQNISAFGGDPENVTIFGESAGSVSTNILQATPLAKGLFHRVIGQSTSQMDPDGGLVGRQDLRSAEEYGRDFGLKLGAGSIAEMRALSAEDILSEFTFFWPTERDGHVLPDFVYNIFANGQQSDLPTLVGSNSDEGATIRMEWVRRDTDPAGYDQLYREFEDPLRQASTDAIQWQMRSWGDLQAKTGQSSSWLYWYDHPWPGRKELGAFHGAEIIYIFGNLHTKDQPWEGADTALSELMANYWVNFARNGDPNGPGLPQWPAYNPASPELMRLSPEPGMIPTPRVEAALYLDQHFDGRR